MITSSQHISCRSLRVSRWYLTLTTILQLLIFAVVQSTGETDWDSHCGVCTCKWISGKKSANCRDQSFTVIPTEVSSEIQVIDLSNNPMRKLRRNEFLAASLDNLHKLFLRNCTILEISKDALNGLQVLIELDLSQNQLKVLHPSTFKGLVKLRTLILNNNNIERLEDNLFTNLPFLSKLEIRANRLHHVGEYVFNATFKVMNIDLEHNRLSVLNDETFRNLTVLKSLSLNGNPWNCTCNLQQFQKFAINNNLYTAPTSCAEPPLLRGKLWSDLSSDNFVCKPRIIEPHGNLLVEADGHNVSMVCRISGSPKPDVEWIFNNRHSINSADQRIVIRNSPVANRPEVGDEYTSELIIINVNSMDEGDYICVANNHGGKAEVLFRVKMPVHMNVCADFNFESGQMWSVNSLRLVCVVVIVLLVILIMVGLVMCCFFRRDGPIDEKREVIGELDKSNSSNDSMLGSSVCMDTQKNLLIEQNPVEKPPRHTEINGSSNIMDNEYELKKMPVNDILFGNPSDESQSINVADAKLPPDLLAFPSRFTQSPPSQITALYRGVNESLMTPVPIIYPAVIITQGPDTIHRNPRTPSWIPSTEIAENRSSGVVFDNLGCRTTARGHSIQNVNADGNSLTSDIPEERRNGRHAPAIYRYVAPGTLIADTR